MSRVGLGRAVLNLRQTSCGPHRLSQLPTLQSKEQYIAQLAVPGDEDLQSQLLRGLRQEDCEFKASLCNLIKPCLERQRGHVESWSSSVGTCLGCIGSRFSLRTTDND